MLEVDHDAEVCYVVGFSLVVVFANCFFVRAPYVDEGDGGRVGVGADCFFELGWVGVVGGFRNIDRLDYAGLAALEAGAVVVCSRRGWCHMADGNC